MYFMKHVFQIPEGESQRAYLAPEIVLLEIGTEAGFAVSSSSNEGMGEDTEQDPWS